MAERKHSRRDFLRGRALFGAAAGAIEGAIDATLDRALGGTASPEIDRTAARVQVLTRRAMACLFELRLITSASRNDAAAGMAALDVIEQVENELTVYRDHSDLVDLNRRAAAEPVAVSGELYRLLELCGRLWNETEGAFDPTSGPLSKAWGFWRREGRLPDGAERAAALAHVGWTSVALDAADRTVRFLREGVELNANSFGKGHALDRAAKGLAAAGVPAWLAHGGSSSLLAYGHNPLRDHEAEAPAARDKRGWIAGLRDPQAPERRLAEVVLWNESLGTSGQGTQFFEHEGRRYGHLIDPRSGWPAEGLYSATAIAPTGVEADALSTALYVLGVEGTAEFCQRRPDVRALLLAPASEPGGPTVVHAFNLSPEDWSPSEAV
ncbi:MAG: FAD:protein FMN transferase [Lacipirellulaceae bacterium]